MIQVGIDRSRQMIEDLVFTQCDVPEFARRHKLHPEQLSEWIGKPENQRVLANLCMLADLQTQMLLSRFRLAAAIQLGHLANPQKDDKNPDAEPPDRDLIRRACVDLLKLELRRASQVSGEGDDPLLALVPTPEKLYGKAQAKAQA